MTLSQWPLVLSLILSVVSPAAAAQLASGSDAIRSVSVTGRGSVTVIPDMASADVGVSVIDPDARKAKASVDASMTKIVSLAKSLGVRDADLMTAAVNIEPRYDDTNRTRVRGYEVTQSVTAVIRDLTKLDAFLDGAVQAGANHDFNVTLSSSRETALRQQAVRLAIDSAKEQADAAARQLNVRLGPVRTITLNPTPGFVPATLARAVSPDSARFLPGTLKIEADVAVVFTIEDASR